jgi:hypothetical protein
MQLVNVFDWFVNPVNDRSWWPLDTSNEADVQLAVPLLCAAVRMSGQMEDANTEFDLQCAYLHTMHLINCDVFTTQQLIDEGQQVIQDMADWEAKMQDTINQLDNLN